MNSDMKSDLKSDMRSDMKSNIYSQKNAGMSARKRLHNCSIISKKELRGLINERTIVLALLLQFFIAMFSSFLLIGLASMYNPDSISQNTNLKYPIAYSGTTSLLLSELRESPDYIVYQMDFSEAVAALSERQLSAVIWVPDISETDYPPIKVAIYTIENDIQSGIVNSKLKQTLIQYETDLREIRSDRLTQTPIEIDMPNINSAGEFYEFVYGILIPLLLFMPAIISGALIIDMITEEYQHNTLETLLSTHMSYSDMVWGKIFAAFILVPLQALLWLMLLSINGIVILDIALIILHVSVASLILILVAAAFALKYRERTNAQFMYSATIVVLMLLFLSFAGNTANIIVKLSVGTAGINHYFVLVLLLIVVAILSLIISKISHKSERLGEYV